MNAPSRDTLMGFADGQLDPTTREQVEAYLAANPDVAAEVSNWARQNDAIRTLFEPAGAEPVPVRLHPRRMAAELTTRRHRLWRQAVAAVLLVGLGLGAGWFARAWSPAPQPSTVLIADAVRAHDVFVAENRHAVEVAASEEDHLTSWLSNRLETPLAAPDLAAEGFTLVGGRLLPGTAAAGGRAAQLMYENAGRDRVTIYVTAALPDREHAYEFASLEGAEAFYWANARITCTVVGTLPEPQMQIVSQAIYRQLTGDGEPEEHYRS
ncbi:anti-sigma factor [Devosia sp. 1566]|uniref:anti-sigma factor family protein n=1 Tax=Devosia sp. 1566 TaxID=2499144 RepID=UPI000FD70818|nr:anti-sigma factor [Devosia sp. 1566]